MRLMILIDLYMCILRLKAKNQVKLVDKRYLISYMHESIELINQFHHF